MRNVLIVGAGQAGLQLGLCLVARGYAVTLVAARTADATRNGRVMSTQVLFGPAVELERRHGLDFWREDAPQLAGIRFTRVDPPAHQSLRFVALWERYAQSVDQRVKLADWLELFASRSGAAVVHCDATPDDLVPLAARHDLTVVAAGKGPLAELFERDPQRSPFDRPQRALSCIYLRGVAPDGNGFGAHVAIHVVPGVGETFTIPALTTSGPCHIVLMEGVPGGPFDCWRDRPNPPAHLERLLALMRQYMPWEYERCASAEPADAGCTLVGGYSPAVRRAIGTLPDGTPVLGMGDVVVLNDPLAGQGANNAAHCAEIYLRSIVGRGVRPFDTAWMQRTFDTYWAYAQHPTHVTHALLGPPPPHVERVLAAASRNEAVARRFAHGYTDPADFATWIMNAAASDAYLASVSEDPASSARRVRPPASDEAPVARTQSGGVTCMR